jgi:hypothetical protein
MNQVFHSPFINRIGFFSIKGKYFTSADIPYYCRCRGPGWLNELGSWITLQLIQAYHQYGRGFAPGFANYKKGCTRLAAQVIKQETNLNSFMEKERKRKQETYVPVANLRENAHSKRKKDDRKRFKKHYQSKKFIYKYMYYNYQQVGTVRIRGTCILS